MKFPVFTAFSATFAYLGGHAVLLLKALWLPALLLTAALAAVMPKYLASAVAISELGANPDPNEAMALAGPLFRSIGLLLMVGAVLYPMLIVASLRRIVRGDDRKLPFYLNFAGDELRTLGAYTLIFVMVTISYLVFALALGVIGGVVGLVSPVAGAIGAFGAAVAGLGVLAWFMTRISVTFPAVMATRTLGLAQSWRATKGHALRLFAFWALIAIVLVLAALIHAAALTPNMMSVYGELVAAGADEAAQQQIQIRILQAQRDLYDIESPLFWPFTIGSFIYTMAMIAVINVAAGTAWRCLKGEPSRAAPDAGGGH